MQCAFYVGKNPQEMRAPDIIDVTGDIESKVMGIKWDVKNDLFFFKIDIPEHDLTKRGMLS